MTAPRRIAVVTGSRAEYGLLSHLMRALQRHGEIALEVIVTGTHLEPRFGMTADEITADGFAIARRVPMALGGDSGVEIAHAMARVTAGMAEALDALQPDLMVVLGDRYEILAAALAATALGVPIAHLHGGELTQGAIDDQIRHAITKLSQLHFAAAPAYRDRIVQMGEARTRVFCEGALGVDAIAGLARFDRVEIARRLGVALGKPLLLVTYHPVTADGATGGAGIDPLLAALERISGATVVITGVNADPAHGYIEQRLASFAALHPGRVVLKASLGQHLYLSVMAEADAVVGNSSSGVIEAPIMRVPAVNIGDRQTGRLMPASVVTCEADAGAIESAIRQALTPDFRAERCQGADFGAPGVAERIATLLASVPLAGLSRKPFIDIAPRDAAAVHELEQAKPAAG